ncbi:hypothetical protein SHI21_15835 [Bacteriovorax sp. PP10]|uniref:Outer membrane protein beta-barrel domain-containing protein n=1 Tax=Bacteriovorax antarcticus TaxID=3088717 RepID=A0ABU5VXB5_9BACT|nr:hypothetical protein [Bacteriovorax sp. PP10]MEA9357701.1 hypothetical protein [Bacteriovorax sp. PP10]
MTFKKQILTKLTLFNIFLLASAHASSSIPSQLNFHIGSISATYAENQDTLKASDGTTSTTAKAPYSGTASSMPFAISYEYFPGLSKSYFGRVSGPVMGSTPDRYYSASLGMNFYFGQIGSQAVIKDSGFEMKVLPKFRYYAGPAIGIGYLVYNTKSATKNDMLFEIGAQGGVLYSLNPKWALSAELGGARAIGSLTSATVIKILIGTSYSLDIWGTK